LMALARQELGEIVAAVEWMDRACLECVVQQQQQRRRAKSSSSFQLPISMRSDNDDGTQPYPHSILLETHGSNEAHDMEKLDRFLTRAMTTTTEDADDSGQPSSPIVDNGVVAQDLRQLQAFWEIREMANPAVSSLGYGYKYDLSLPVEEFDSFGARIQQHIQQELKQQQGRQQDGNNNDELPSLLCTNWGHLLDGNLHLNFTTPGKFELDPNVVECLEPFVFDQVTKLGGSISAEHGIGQSKRNLLTRVHEPAVLEAMRNLKRVFDPAAILNPSKVLPDDDDQSV